MHCDVSDKEVTQRHGKVAHDFDRVAREYPDQINAVIAFTGAELDFFIDAKKDYLLRIAGQHFGYVTSLSVLDLGCGVGGYDGKLNGAFGELHGIDISSESVALAAANNPVVTYASYRGDVLPYENHRFDVTFAICVMHHVPPSDWPGFVAEMFRVLRPGGLAVVFEHNPLNPATQYVVRSCPIDDDAVLLWPRQTRKLLRDAGFGNVGSRTILSVPPKGSLLGALDRLLGFLPFGAQYYVTGTRGA